MLLCVAPCLLISCSTMQHPPKRLSQWSGAIGLPLVIRGMPLSKDPLKDPLKAPSKGVLHSGEFAFLTDDEEEG